MNLVSSLLVHDQGNLMFLSLFITFCLCHHNSFVSLKHSSNCVFTGSFDPINLYILFGHLHILWLLSIIINLMFIPLLSKADSGVYWVGV